MIRLGKYKSKIIANKILTEKVRQVRFARPEGFQFVAGQYVNLLIPGERTVRRSYSLSSEADANTLETIVDISPQGPGSKFFGDARIGQEFEFLGPLGDLTLENVTASQFYFLATGTGIAPFLSMFESELSSRLQAKQVNLLWGLRFEQDIYFLEKLNKLKQMHSNFNFHLHLSQPGENWKGKSGYITKALQVQLSNQRCIGDTAFYLCGAGQMIDDASQIILKDGYAEPSIHVEKYY